MKKAYNIYFCGIGGQGVLTASEVCCWAAIIDRHHIKKTEVHGMSQRGGSVESHIRLGDRLYSPLIGRGEADILVSFNKDEHDNNLNILKNGGIDLINDLLQAEIQLKNKKMINTYLLGALSNYLPISLESWKLAINRVCKKYVEENQDSFLAGRKRALLKVV